MPPPDLTQLRKDVEGLLSDCDKTKLLQDLDALEQDCRNTDQLFKQLRDDEVRAAKKQRKHLFLAIPFFGLGSYVVLFYLLANSITTGVAKGRNRDVSAAAEPLYYWMIVIFQATVGTILFSTTIWLIWRLLASNSSTQRTL
jgi:hypothetical protein